MAQPSIHGRFVWQELLSSEMGVAEKFYSNLVGWGLQAPTHSGSPYTLFSAHGVPVAGVMPLADEARALDARPHWLPYMGAEDLDGTLARAEQLGARVLRPAADVQGVGRYAVLADPQGAAFGVYRPQRSHIPTGQPRRGEFAWQELATSDPEGALTFYTALFGWQVLRRMDMGPAGIYWIFGQGQLAQGGLYKVAAQTPAPYWLSYIEVDDVDRAAASTRKAGGQLVSGPMDVPGGRIAHLVDPGGVLFAVHTLLTSTEAEPTAAEPAARRPSTRKTAKRAPAKIAKKPVAKTARKTAKRTAKKTARKRGSTKAARKTPSGRASRGRRGRTRSR